MNRLIGGVSPLTRNSLCLRCFACICAPMLVMCIWCSLLADEEEAPSKNVTIRSKQGGKAGSQKAVGAFDGKLPSPSEVILWRTAEIERLRKGLHRVGTIDPHPGFEMDIPAGHINDAVVRLLVELQSLEAVPDLCDEIAASGIGGKQRFPAAYGLIRLGGSSLPGIYQSLEKTAKTDNEINIFAFVLYSIDGGDRELTLFRLERQIKRRTDGTDRNTTFKENARKLLKCFSTPDFFRIENSPFNTR